MNELVEVLHDVETHININITLLNVYRQNSLVISTYCDNIVLGMLYRQSTGKFDKIVLGSH